MSESPDLDQLQRLLDGSLEPAESKVVEQFLETDPSWQRALEDLSGLPHLTSEYLQPARTSSKPERSEEVLDLIDRLKKESLPEPEAEPWREVLTPPPEPNSNNLLGTLGDHEVLELIAEGGMGLVFKARDPSLDRFVAIKALSPRLASNATARERFLREARAVAALEHENILPIYNVEEGREDGGIPWFAMRYVTGSSLDDLLESTKGPLPFDRICSIARQATAALRSAHERGIIHRDIKPGNILLDAEGDGAWVTDFGLARTVEDPSLTYPGMVAGTPQFMAPEQAAGGVIDHRTDLFSLGAVLYRCATGSLPFRGRTSAAVMKNVTQTEPPHPGRLNPALPVWFRRLLQNLLAKDPDHRIQSAAEVLTAIEKRRAPRPRLGRNRKLQFAGGGFLVLLAGLALLLQVPAIAYRVNGMVASDERPFLSTQRLGTYTSLSAAIEKARPGDTIEIRSDRTLVVSEAIRIPEGKPLTIRSAPSSASRIDVSGCPDLFLATRSDLALERLTLLRTRKGPGTILRLEAGTLTLEGCHVVSEGDPGKPHLAEVISVAMETRLQLIDTILLTSWALPVTLGRQESPGKEISVSIDNCLISGYALVGIGCDRSAEVKLDMVATSYTGPIMGFNRPDRPLPTIIAKAERCIFNSEGSLWWLPRQTLEQIQQQVRWQGRNNLFQRNLAFVRNTRIPDRRADPALIPTLADWQALPNVLCDQPAQTQLWNERNLDRPLPTHRAEITAADLESAAAPFLKSYPHLGPNMKRVGPNGE